MIWLIGILNIYLDEQRLIRYYMIKHLKLLKPREKLYIYINKTTVARANKSATYYTGEGSNPENQQLPEKLHKPIIRKFEKPNVYSSITDNILGSDLADIQCITK